jgi:hypothetical protein
MERGGVAFLLGVLRFYGVLAVVICGVIVVVWWWDVVF